MSSKIRNFTLATIIGASAITASLATGSSNAATKTTKPTASASKVNQKEIEELRKRVLELTKGNADVQKNLTTFDTLDYDVFSNQKWDRLKESHAPNVKVVWPDGHFTTGIEKHIEDLKGLFVHAPDTRIKEHPVAFGVGNMTVVEGVFEGTFTKPMPDGKGGFIQPTGKAFKMPMATIGFWKDGTMYEEHLFWDNATSQNRSDYLDQEVPPRSDLRTLQQN
jgi:SnoaL-like polyketide cyclase